MKRWRNARVTLTCWQALQGIMGSLQQSTLYEEAKVDGWCQGIVDFCIAELKAMNKPFKYIGTELVRRPPERAQNAPHAHPVQ